MSPSINPTNIDRDSYGGINPTSIESSLITFSFKHLFIPANSRRKKPKPYCITNGVDKKHYVKLVTRLAEYSRQQIVDIKKYPHCHPVDFEDKNVTVDCFDVDEMDNDSDLTPYQLNIEASSGRIVGGFVGTTFFIRWLDFKHEIHPSKR